MLRSNVTPNYAYVLKTKLMLTLTCLSMSAVRASSRAMSPSSSEVSAITSCQLAPPAHASTRPVGWRLSGG